jgi:hypothetical protein
MRNWIIGAAALLAVAAPGVAAAQTGYVGAVYADSETNNFDSEAYGVEGAVAFSGSGSIVFEVNASILDNDSHLFGGFVGIADANDSTTWTAGLEASKFYDRWTLAGAVAYGNNDDANVDGYGVNVEARVFPTDNFRLSGNIGWANVDAGAADDDAFTYGVGGEYQFAALPISIAAGYNRTEFDNSNVESDAVTVAVRYNWGGSLFDRDRNGASQAGIAGSAGIGL